MSSRIYLPLTSSGLAALVASRAVPGPLRAHAVTEDLRAGWPEGDDEEWEYAALHAAARHSAAQRAAADRPRRFVVAADVEGVAPVEGDDPTLVEVAGGLVWSQIASAHVDTEDDAGSDAELAWFARQEIADLPDL
ncbi:hypothetical protein [Nocardioides sp.]|uniref:DUF6912 family protein n=1 Tax=Nocardioides sp. TaxID=35761 RepID=UPI002732AFB4|nr:hypothetical protein [Nocardioides sp.]MDP3892551.1 hypothetical protein [Nocardioides sp.]